MILNDIIHVYTKISTLYKFLFRATEIHDQIIGTINHDSDYLQDTIFCIILAVTRVTRVCYHITIVYSRGN